MIARLGAIGTSVAGAAVAAAQPHPVLASFLGLPFEVPSMLAAMFGCTVTRVIIGQSDKSHWVLKVPVDVLALGVTFVLVVERRPELFAALLSGIFVGTLGATIIKIAERWGSKALAILLPDGVVPTSTPAPPPPPPPPTE